MLATQHLLAVFDSKCYVIDCEHIDKDAQNRPYNDFTDFVAHTIALFHVMQFRGT